jgi:hypothetical protein
MADIKKQIAAEEENINLALDNLKKVIKTRKRIVIELAAMGTFLSNIYNGIENILKQVLKAKNKKIPASQNWHKDLIRLSTECDIISKDLSNRLYNYLGFRHFFIHGYEFNLKWKEMKSLVENIDVLWREVKDCIAEFIAEI